MSRTVCSLRVTCCLIAALLAPTASRAIDLAGMDKAVAPGDNFNEYANGGWLKITEIPPDKAAYGADTIVEDRTREQLEPLIQECAGTGGKTDTDAQKIGDFYRILTVRNIDPWYEAFPIAPGQTLYLTPDARVRVW